MAAADTTRRKALLAALKALLEDNGWSGAATAGKSGELVMSLGGGAPVRFRIAGAGRSAGRQQTSQLVVNVHDDAQGEPKRRDDWSDLPAIAAAAHGGGEAHARFGWDLVFGFGADASALGAYAAALRSRYGESDLPQQTKVEVLDHIDSRPDVRAHTLDTLRSEVGGARAEGKQARNTLIAFSGLVGDRVLSQAALLTNAFVAPELDRLARKLSAQGGVPLLILGEEVRLGALDACVRKAFWQATGRSLSDRVYRHLAHLGYVHLYLANGEAMRVDQDFDPNTRNLTDLLTYSEGAAFTLCCARDHVFHEGASAAKEAHSVMRWEIGALKTLGQRFYLADGFCIADFGGREREHMGLIRRHGDARLNEYAREIAAFSGGRCGVEEAKAALEKLAGLSLSREARVLSRSDLRTVATEVLTLDRRRPTHVAVAEAAIAQSGALIDLGEGRFTWRDGLVGELLLATRIAVATRYALIDQDHAPLGRVFADRMPDPDLFAMACHLAQVDEIDGLSESLVRLLTAYGLRSGPTPDRQIQAENLIRLLFAVVGHLSQVSGASRAEVLTGILRRPGAADRSGERLRLVGMALPQFTFFEVELVYWEIDNCNLRSAVFVGCNLKRWSARDSFLGGAVFRDCRLDPYTALTKSNLSGAWFGGETNPEGLFDRSKHETRLRGSSWTMAYVDGRSLAYDEEDRIEERQTPSEKIATLAEAGCEVTDMEVGGLEGAVTVNAGQPASLRAALRRAFFDDMIAFERSEGVELVARASEAMSEAPGLPARAILRARCVVRGLKGLAAADPQGGLWGVGPAFHAPDRWIKLGALKGEGELQSIACFDADDDADLLIAAVWGKGIGWRSNDGGAEIYASVSIEIFQGKVVRGELQEPKGALVETDAGAITAMLWIRHATGSAEELYFGSHTGDVCSLAPDNAYQHGAASGAWRRRVIIKGQGAAVGALGYARRSQAFVVAYVNGAVVGLRTPAGEDAPALFSFRSALRRIFGLVYLGGAGDQFVLVGSPSPAASEEQEQLVLSVLLNAAGDVLAVAPKSVTLDDAESDEGDVGVAQAAVQALETGESIRQLLERYAPERSRLDIRPSLYRDSSGEVLLDITANDAGTLATVLETADGPAFRHISVTVLCRDEQGGPVAPIKPVFTDHELGVLQTDPKRLKISLPVRFGIDTASATLSVAIDYASAARGGIEIARKTFDFQADIIWRENPYESGGRAAGRAQFYGRASEIERCVRLLLAGKGVGVRAARRMGKSSFLASVAREIRASERLAVMVSLAGAVKPRVELSSLILRGAEDPLAPAPPEFVAVLRREFEQTAPQGRRAIETLEELARARFRPPTVILIDEWGVVSSPESQQRDDQFEQEIGELIQNPGQHRISVCLASTPGDFAYQETAANSAYYRGLQDSWIDMGPLQDGELKDIMTTPVTERSGSFADPDACFALLKELTSGDPYAANVVMARAFDAAMERTAGGDLVVTPGDIDNEAVRRTLAGIYEVHRGYTLNRLTAANQAKLRSDAAASMPAWEQEETPIPERHVDQRQWNVFGDAGFRKVGVGKAANKFVVWIPRGLSLNFRDEVG